MSFKNDVLRTWQPQPVGIGICNASMGLAGEVGEIIDLLKKYVHHDHPLDREKVLKELGDVLYYMEILYVYTGTSRIEAEAAVIAKLKKRYPDGFSSEKSINRGEE